MRRWATIRWFALCAPRPGSGGPLVFPTAAVPTTPGRRRRCAAFASAHAARLLRRRSNPRCSTDLPLQSSVPLFLGLAGAGVGLYYAKEQGMLDSFLGAAPGTNVSPQALPRAYPCWLTMQGAAALLLFAPTCHKCGCPC